MPKKGKHRRPKVSPITRGFVTAGTGGAAIALPLIGAAGAHAAEKAAPAVAPEKAVTAAASSPFSAGSAAATHVAQKKASPTTYSVVPGDYLAKIADEHDVRGGWKKLYADNRERVGDNPSLIHPGLKLTLGAKAKAPEKSQSPASPERSSSKPSSSKPSSDSGSSDSGSAVQSSAPSSSGDSASSGAATQTSASGFTTPVDGATVITPYHLAGAMWSSGYHTGLDFAASSGTTVKAVGQGTVVSAGWAGAYGNQIVIQQSDGTYSQYAHLSSLAVSSGQSVSGGQPIGLSGTTGNSTGPHLHFEIRTGPSYGSDIDPVAYLRQHGVSI
ncbi:MULTISPECIES: LysM peptidoglycan-binding domain-containing M23 family metallopeptidase [unclassified Streptomyces]|uniref:M23 family metallopeptidase n=1 Tax=unclassified Streptomyces TaxID=2593676 RepID=UPI002DD87040|nr:LysM peptidoglycan-binding domain-containing M23 family metallopeptidase [Streptomyces sp. NBC_01750]WSA98897.1 LysM peptidoglycan-binding domain-containing M23 family metallopeptidase [Streptomyces sp. NBC_01794]WSD36531.1 LysM peptidoglycan-binding domain-containing M23 family metallopeptidase [Streptomyces sp. NBC_01750]